MGPQQTLTVYLERGSHGHKSGSCMHPCVESYPSWNSTYTRFLKSILRHMYRYLLFFYNPCTISFGSTTLIHKYGIQKIKHSKNCFAKFDISSRRDFYLLLRLYIQLSLWYIILGYKLVNRLCSMLPFFKTKQKENKNDPKEIVTHRTAGLWCSSVWLHS